jgi:hypothetical protein
MVEQKNINMDKYTKIILTAIAVNLTILTLSNVDILPKVHANDTALNYNETKSADMLQPEKEEMTLNINSISPQVTEQLMKVWKQTNDPLRVIIDKPLSVQGTYNGLKVPIELHTNNNNPFKVEVESKLYSRALPVRIENSTLNVDVKE